MRGPNMRWRDSGVVDWSLNWHDGQQWSNLLTSWGSLLLTHTLPIPPSPPPHKHDSSVTPLPPHPHTPTPSVRGSLVTKECWVNPFTAHTHTHTHSPLTSVRYTIDLVFIPSTGLFPLHFPSSLSPLTYHQLFQLLPGAHWIALSLHRLGQLCLTTT